MSKFTAMILLMSDDVSFLRDTLYNTRYNLLRRDTYYYVHTFGETKNKNIAEELEGELSSLGAYPLEVEVYWGI